MVLSICSRASRGFVDLYSCKSLHRLIEWLWIRIVLIGFRGSGAMDSCGIGRGIVKLMVPILVGGA